MKKAVKISGIILLIVLVAAFIIPILFKKQITALVKKEINKYLTAKVDFKDVNLSLFRHFPKVSIGLEDLSIVDTNEFASDTLVSTKTLDASVNLINAIKGKDIKVYGVFLESPRIHALVNKEGKTNWDIVRKQIDTTGITDTNTSEFKMRLQKYRINNGYVFYKDESSDISAEIFGLNHEGSGDFTEDVFTLSTKTKANSSDFTYASVPYLVNTKAEINADIQIDNKTNKYTFKTDDIKLNDLRLNADGFFQLINDSTYNMDIKFKSPSNEFKSILSLIPVIYKKDFDKIKTSGQAAFNGFVKGIYGPQQIPAYDVNLEVKNGFFQYPDLPKPVKNIQLAMNVSNPDGKTDNAVINISRGHVEMDNEPFDFKLLFKNPETSQYIDAIAKGKLDLGNVSKFIKLEGNTKLAGLVWADAFARGNMSALKSQQGNFVAGGFFDIRNLFYSSNDFPQPIRNGNMKVQLQNSGGIADNTSVTISSGHMEVGNDPVDFSLQLQHPVSTIDFSGRAKGRFTLQNIKQFVTLEKGTSIGGTLNADIGFSGNKAAIDKKEYDKINISGTAALNNLKYVSADYPTGINIANTQLTFNQKNLTLNNLNGDYLNTNFAANGSFNNLVGYAMNDDPLSGTLNVSAGKMNLNDWIETSTSSAPATNTSSTPFLVPSNLNLLVNAKAVQVQYDKVNYNNINGVVALNDQTVKLQNVKAEALDGTIALDGSYSTKTNKKHPAISMSYDVNDMDVQKVFYSFNTVQSLMPIGKFLAGKLNSQLSMSGHLKSDMMPDLISLSGKGNLLLVEGVLNKFAPLEKLAATLQIDRLKSISLKDIKAYFEFASGKVLVKPFTIKVHDIEMQVGGVHGFDQSINYVIGMKVPRKYIGTGANNFLNNLVLKANTKGVPVKLEDMVDLNVKMVGSIADPSIQINLKQVAGDAIQDLKEQAADFAKEKVESVKQTVKDSLESVKETVVKDLKDEIKNKIFGNKDSAKQTGNADSTKKKTTETIKNTLDKLLNKKKKLRADTIK
jgi:hypothetical protein